jgi:outer membrane lipoprotein-sorting protein
MTRLLTLLLPAILLGPSAMAETPEERGLAIAMEMDTRDTGWGDQTADMYMILRNRQGEESTREIRTKTLEIEGDGDKSLTVFDSPKDVKGTAFLSYTHALTPDDQWLYLPALKRVKRISSRNKSGPFMGSEFAFEDLSSQEVEKYSYKLLREEPLDGKETFVVERRPAYEFSGYTRSIVWIDKDIWRPLKIEYYDRKDALLKTLTFRDYKQYLDRYWRPDEMFMDNHQTGKSTLLTWKDYAFATGLSDRDFDRNSLKRAR